MPSARHTVASFLPVIPSQAFYPSYYRKPSARHTGACLRSVIASFLPVIPAHAGIQSIRQFLIRKSCLTGFRPTPERRRGALTGLTSRVFGMCQRVSNTARHTVASLRPVIPSMPSACHTVAILLPVIPSMPSTRHTVASLLPVIPSQVIPFFCPSYRRMPVSSRLDNSL